MLLFSEPSGPTSVLQSDTKGNSTNRATQIDYLNTLDCRHFIAGLADHLDLMDKKVNLSAWVDIDFPNDLPPAPTTEASHPTATDYHLPFIFVGQPKSEDSWHSLVKMARPNTVPPPDFPSIQSLPRHTPTRLPRRTADKTELTDNAKSSPENIGGDFAVPSTLFKVGDDEDAMDGEFVPKCLARTLKGNQSLAAWVPSAAAQEAAQRRKRKAAEAGSRRERKRLHNKDSARRYRREKRQEYDIVEGEN